MNTRVSFIGPIEDKYRIDEMDCGLCGAKMIVFRNQYGSTSWSGAMAGIKKEHDYFSCPAKDKLWHRQAVALLEEADRTPSKFLSDKFIEEAEKIVKNEKETKNTWKV